ADDDELAEPIDLPGMPVVLDPAHRLVGGARPAVADVAHHLRIGECKRKRVHIRGRRLAEAEPLGLEDRQRNTNFTTRRITTIPTTIVATIQRPSLVSRVSSPGSAGG